MKIVVALILLSLFYGCAATPDSLLQTDLSLRDIDGVVRQPFADDDGPLTVLIFVTIDCPIANSYAPEINRLARWLADQHVKCFVVQVDRNLSVEQARKHAEEFGISTAVLMDADHKLTNAVGATVTPEAALIATKPRLCVLYLGRIDDQYVDLGKKRFEPSRQDLRLAVESALRGEPVQPSRTKAVGCPIPE